MPASSLHRFIQDIRKSLLLDASMIALSDGQLLKLFIEHKDQAAFEALLLRHAPMVWGVCRRVLRNAADAEEAFQATCMVLARKAASIVPREMVAGWLYGVARLGALKLQASTAKRCQRERQVTQMPEPERASPGDWQDVLPLLEQALTHLPEKYRVPVVLCDLEGKTRREAARQLGWPEGSVSSRLSRARAMLAKRLARQGVTLSAGGLTILLAEHAASASVPRALVAATLKSSLVVAGGQAAAAMAGPATALANKILLALLAAKLRVITIPVCLAALMISGAGWYAYCSSWTQVDAAVQVVKQSSDGAVVTRPEKEPDRLIIAAKFNRVAVQGSMGGDKIDVDGTRLFLYHEGPTEVLVVDEIAKERSTQRDSLAFWHITGRVRSEDFSSTSDELGILKLKAGSRKVCADGDRHLQEICQLEVAVKGNRLAVSCSFWNGTRMQAEADSASYDQRTTMLVLQSNQTCFVHIGRPGNPKADVTVEDKKIELALCYRGNQAEDINKP